MVGIFKVDDCTDSVTLVNHPPDPLPPPTQSRLTASQQQIDVSLETSQNGELANESEQPEQQSQSEPSEQLPPAQPDLSSACGRDTTFAPTLESTVITKPVQEEVSEVAPNTNTSELSMKSQSTLTTINA